MTPPTESFSKEERLKKTRDFRRVYNAGASFRKDPLLLYRLANNLSVSRLGIVVSARTIKLANRRNRIKRILRDIYRRQKKDLKTGFDIVVIVKKNILGNKKPYNYIISAFLELTKLAKISK